MTVQLPLILDRPVRFGAAMGGATAALPYSSLEFGVEATVTSL